MLALVLTVALAQCTKDTDCKGDRLCVAGVCSATDAPRALSPLAVRLDAQRPSLYWPISSIAAGAVAFLVGVVLAGVTGSGDALLTGASLGGGLTIGGVISLITTLWARGRVGQLMDQIDGR